MQQKDLAGVEHWDGVYRDRRFGKPPTAWEPATYDARTRGHVIQRAMNHRVATTILEVGCGDSFWLAYLARATGAKVAGIDYSEIGCQLARERLKAENVQGEIFCGDIFQTTVDQVGRYDFVYSIGLVEHFDDLAGVLKALAKFVAPGGTLFTEVPNLRSMHGLMAWVWQPELLAKHKFVSCRDLAHCYENLNFHEVTAGFSGVFSIDVVSWEYYARWPKLARRIVPRIRYFQRQMERVLRRVKTTQGSAVFSPFIHVYGRKPTGV